MITTFMMFAFTMTLDPSIETIEPISWKEIHPHPILDMTYNPPEPSPTPEFDIAIEIDDSIAIFSIPLEFIKNMNELIQRRATHCPWDLLKWDAPTMVNAYYDDDSTLALSSFFSFLLFISLVYMTLSCILRPTRRPPRPKKKQQVVVTEVIEPKKEDTLYV